MLPNVRFLGIHVKKENIYHTSQRTEKKWLIKGHKTQSLVLTVSINLL